MTSSINRTQSATFTTHVTKKAAAPQPVANFEILLDATDGIDLRVINFQVSINPEMTLTEYGVPPAAPDDPGTRPTAPVLKPGSARVLAVLYINAYGDPSAKDAVLVVEISSKEQKRLGLSQPYVYLSNVYQVNGQTQYLCLDRTLWVLPKIVADQLAQKTSTSVPPAVASAPEATAASVGVTVLSTDALAHQTGPFDQNYWSDGGLSDPTADIVLSQQETFAPADMDPSLGDTTGDTTVIYNGDVNQLYDDGYGSEGEITSDPTVARDYYSQGGVTAHWITDLVRQYSFSGQQYHFDPFAVYSRSFAGSARSMASIDAETGQVSYSDPAVTYSKNHDLQRLAGDFQDYLFTAKLTPPSIGIMQWVLDSNLYVGNRQYSANIDAMDPFHNVYDWEGRLSVLTPPIARRFYIVPYVQAQFGSLFSRFDLGSVLDLALGRRDFLSASFKLWNPAFNTHNTYYDITNLDGSVSESGSVSEQYELGDITTSHSGGADYSQQYETTGQPAVFNHTGDVIGDLRYLHHFSDDAYMGGYVQYDPWAIGYAGASAETSTLYSHTKATHHLAGGVNFGGSAGWFEAHVGVGAGGFVGGAESFGVGQIDLMAHLNIGDTAWAPELTGLGIIPLTTGLADHGWQLDLKLPFSNDNWRGISPFITAELGTSTLEQGLGLGTWETDRLQASVISGIKWTPNFNPQLPVGEHIIEVSDTSVSVGGRAGDDLAGPHQDNVTGAENLAVAASLTLDRARSTAMWRLDLGLNGQFWQRGLGRPNGYQLYFTATPVGIQSAAAESQALQPAAPLPATDVPEQGQ